MNWNLEEAVAYYQKQGAPGDQSALVSLLREIQQEYGGAIPGHILQQLADSFQIKETYLHALVKRIPSLRLADTHCLEVCSGPNCGRQAALMAFVEKTYGERPKNVTVKYVPCMRMCGKGPNIKWDGKLYHGADEALIRRFVEGR